MATPSKDAVNAKGKGKERALSEVAVNNMHHAFDASATSSSQISHKGKGKEQRAPNAATSNGVAVLDNGRPDPERAIGRSKPTPSGATQRFIEQANDYPEGQDYDGDDSDEEEEEDDFTYEESRWVGSVPRERLVRGGTWTPVDNETFWNHTCVVGRTQVTRSLGVPLIGTMPGYGHGVPFWAQTCRAGRPVGDTEWDQMRGRMRALMGVKDESSTIAATSSAIAPQAQSTAPAAHLSKGKARPYSSSVTAATSSSFTKPTDQPGDATPAPSTSASSDHLARSTADLAQEGTLSEPAQIGYPSIAAQHLALFAPTPTSIRPALAGMVSATPEWFVPVPTNLTPPPLISAATMLLARFRPGAAVESAPTEPAVPKSAVTATLSTEGVVPAPDLSLSLSNDSISSLPMVKTPYNLSTEDMGQVSTVDKREERETASDPLQGEGVEYAFRASLASLMSRQAADMTPLVRPIARRADGAFPMPARAAPTPLPLDVIDPIPAADPAQLEQSSHHNAVLMARPSRIRQRPRQRTSEDRPVRGPLGPALEPESIEGIPSLHHTIDHIDPSNGDPLLLSTSRPRREDPTLEQSVDHFMGGYPSRPLTYARLPASNIATVPLPRLGSYVRVSRNSLHRIPESSHEGEEEEEEEEYDHHAGDLRDRIDESADRSLMPRPTNIPSHRPPTPLEAGLHDDNPFYVPDRAAGSSRPHRLAPRGSDDSLIDRFERLALESPDRTRRSSWHMSTSDVGTPPPSPLLSRFSTPLAYIAEDEEEEEEVDSSPSPGSDPRPRHVREAQRPMSALLSRFAVPMADIIEEEEEDEEEAL